MIILFTEEEKEWIDKKPFDWSIIPGAPADIEESIRKKLEELKGYGESDKSHIDDKSSGTILRAKRPLDPNDEEEEIPSVDFDDEAESDFVHPVEDVTSEEWLDDDILRRIRSVGVFVLKKDQNKILTGTRKDNDHFGQLCGPGGHVEAGESLPDAAIRETQEEFGITPTDLKFIGLGDFEEDTGLIPALFICTEYDGEMITADFEVDNQRFRTLTDILSYDLFPPFKNSLQILLESFPSFSDNKVST